MIYNYRVKHNGKVYPPGTDVPVEGITTVKETESGSEITKKTEDKPVKTRTGTKKTKK